MHKAFNWKHSRISMLEVKAISQSSVELKNMLPPSLE
jgi:hypothetical protein